MANWLTKYDTAQSGGSINKKEFRQVARDNTAINPKYNTRSFKIDTNLKNKQISDWNKLPKKEQERIIYEQENIKAGTLSKYEPQSGSKKAMEILTHPMTAAGYAVRNEELPDNFSRGPANAHEMATNMINPFFMASELGNSVSSLKQGEFMDAGLHALNTLPLLAEASPIIKPLANVASDLTKAKSLREGIGRIGGIPLEGSLPRLSAEDLKIYRQVQDIGRMKATGKPISEQFRFALDNNIPDEHLSKIFERTREQIEQIIPSNIESEIAYAARPPSSINLQRPPRPSRTPNVNYNPGELGDSMEAMQNRLRERMSSWGDDFSIDDAVTRSFSDDVANPLSSTRDNVIRNTLNTSNINRGNQARDASSYLNLADEEVGMFVNNIDYAALNALPRSIIPGQRFRESLAESFRIKNAGVQRDFNSGMSNNFNSLISKQPYYSGPIMENVPSLSLRSSRGIKEVANKVETAGTSGMKSGDVFTGSTNTSHSSYLPQIKQVFKYGDGEQKFFGYKPMNDMGFLSDFRYSSDDIAKYLNTEIDEQIKRNIVPKSILRPHVKDNRVMLPHYGIQQYQDGGVIEDDRGQWDHPGEVTRIKSNKITMQGVNYPVLGVSDTGHQQMMYPGEEYEYDGNSVTEYPQIAQQGINIKKNSNFTKPNSWLAKYE